MKPDYKEAKVRDKTKVEVVEYSIDKSLINKYKGKKYFIKTYGCQMNEHDTENICAMVEEMGFVPEEHYSEADLIILNTCSIRENAHNKAFGMLGRCKHLKEKFPNTIIGICGCMSQEEVVVEEVLKKHKYVNFVVGTNNLYDLPEVLDKSVKTKSPIIEVTSNDDTIGEDIPVTRASKFKAYVNIIYGCDKFCTYCIVPYTRGKQRSRRMGDILSEVKECIKEGYKEVTLLGQNVNAYGKDLDSNLSFAVLLEEVAKTNIPRIRFMTSHPWDFTDEMIDVISKYDNIMPYIHLPVQSGNDRILKLMGRRYTKEEYLKLFDKIKSKIKNAAITTDIIVGYPSETEEEFNDTLDVVNYCKYDGAFTFIFSPRENTPASRMEDDVTLEEKRDRLARLNEVVNKYYKENNEKLIDKVVPVLIEGPSEKDKNLYSGYTDTMKLVNVKCDKEDIGNIINVRIIDAKTWSLDGEKVDE